MVNTDLLPAAPQIGILSSFFLVELPDSKSQLLEQIVLSIMVFCLGGSHQSLKIFCFNLKKVLQIKKKFSIIIKTRYALRRCLTGTENRGNPARPSRRKLNPVFIIILIIILRRASRRCHDLSTGNTHFWKWSEWVPKCCTNIVCCQDMWELYFECKKFKEKVQTVNFTVFTMCGRELPAEMTYFWWKLEKRKRIFLNVSY